jgi:hypothetical protein
MPSVYPLADDYDPDGEMPADADPVAEYLTDLADVRNTPRRRHNSAQAASAR